MSLRHVEDDYRDARLLRPFACLNVYSIIYLRMCSCSKNELGLLNRFLFLYL